MNVVCKGTQLDFNWLLITIPSQTISEIPFRTLLNTYTQIYSDLRRQNMPQQMIMRQTAKPTNDTATIASTAKHACIPD